MKPLKPDPKIEKILAGAVDALQTAKEQLTRAKVYAAQMEAERDTLVDTLRLARPWVNSDTVVDGYVVANPVLEVIHDVLARYE